MMKRYLPVLLSLISLELFAQAGPGGVGTTDGTSALKLWLRAGSNVFSDSLGKVPATNMDRVLKWKDISGNNNHVFADTDSTSPVFIAGNPLLNGRNSILFSRGKTRDNQRNRLISGYFSKTNDITVYCVFHALNKGGGNNVSPFRSRTYNRNMWYYGAGLVDAGVPSLSNDVSLTFCDTSLAAGAGDSSTFTDYCIKTPLSLNRTYFGVLQKEAWSGNLTISSSHTPASVYPAGKQPVNSPIRFYIGSTSDIKSPSDSTFFDGYIAEVLVYNKLLNSAEKLILENHLAAMYGISLTSNDLFPFDQEQEGKYDTDLAGIGKAADGSSQLTAMADGITEIKNPVSADRGDFLLWSHDNQPLALQQQDIPEGIKNRLTRKWICAKKGDVGRTDLIVDTRSFLSLGQHELVLLKDTDQNGSFSDEVPGLGLFPHSEYLGNGRYLFRSVNFEHGQTFTFAILQPACKEDCDASFSPDGDGHAEVYYINMAGKVSIFDKYGNMVRSLTGPSYWDGSGAGGAPAAPGVYFLISNERVQQTVTLIR